MTRPLVILKTGSTFPELAREVGDFEDWTIAGLGCSRGEVSVRSPDREPLPEPSQIAGVIVTGSHDMVTDHPDGVGAASAWLTDLVEAEVPVLGICYGHQLLAHALGGGVGYHPHGLEVGTVEVERLSDGPEDELLGALPRRFVAHATHAQTVLSLPATAKRLARTPHDPNAAVRFGRRAWGVQFHPEFSDRVAAYYVRAQADALSRQGLDAGAIASAVQPSPAGTLLERFAELAAVAD